MRNLNPPPNQVLRFSPFEVRDVFGVRNRQADKDYPPNLAQTQNEYDEESVAQLKFTYGEKQKVDSVELDNLFTDLQGVLQKHPLVPTANIDALVSEWINDLLFLAGKITEEELQEAMQTFESQGAEAKVEADDEDSAKDDDEDDE